MTDVEFSEFLTELEETILARTEGNPKDRLDVIQGLRGRMDTQERTLCIQLGRQSEMPA